MPTDIDIAQQAKMQRIPKLAAEKLGIAEDHLVPYGHYKAKVSLDYIDSRKTKPDGKWILVTAISPTPAGEGKTTTTVGLGDALNRIGKRAMICIREPSLGPVFGVKGGAAGGGQAQVVPMEDINLHFNGDFHAVTAAHNLLASALDASLWTYDPNAFLPHGASRDGRAEEQPIWLTTSDENPNRAGVLVLADGARSDLVARYDKCLEILDGNDAEAVAAARERWRAYREAGFELGYWQQNETSGRWEKQS